MAKDAKGHGSEARGGPANPGNRNTAMFFPVSKGGIPYVNPAHGTGIAQVGGPLAKWSSAGGKWTAELHPTEGGYRLSERKGGNEVGAAFRPSADNPKIGYTGLHNDAEAIAHFDNHVRNSFDVGMKKVL